MNFNFSSLTWRHVLGFLFKLLLFIILAAAVVFVLIPIAGYLATYPEPKPLTFAFMWVSLVVFLAYSIFSPRLGAGKRVLIWVAAVVAYVALYYGMYLTFIVGPYLLKGDYGNAAAIELVGLSLRVAPYLNFGATVLAIGAQAWLHSRFGKVKSGIYPN